MENKTMTLYRIVIYMCCLPCMVLVMVYLNACEKIQPMDELADDDQIHETLSDESAWSEADLISSNFSLNYVTSPTRALVQRIAALETLGSNPDFFDSFEGSGSGVSNVWRHSGNQRAHRSGDVAREGKKAVKFEIRPDAGTPYRDELVFDGGPFREMKIGSEWWIGFSVYVPRDWVPDNDAGEIIWQSHRKPDDHDVSGGNPPQRLLIMGRTMYFREVWSGQDPLRNKNNFSKDETEVVINRMKAGTWYDIVLHFKWSKKNDKSGLSEVWIDGERKYSLKGPNAWDDQKGPYMKFGIYKSLWRKEYKGKYSNKAKRKGITKRTYYHDNMRLYQGKNGYDRVKPDGSLEWKERPPEPEFTQIMTMNVYPNPTQDRVNLIRPDGVEGNLRVSLIDLQGIRRMEEEWQAGSGKKFMQLVGLQRGVYVIMAQNEKHNCVAKLMVQ